ncbi:MAG TPA: ribonuclease III [Planctomycetaceae bacterium]|nr:ribonuclease III [Planctomycetaceae bacterium]
MSRRVEGDHSEEMLQKCEAALEYRFQNRDLLRICLTHASGANHRLASNERLEFLGDAILGAVVCETLYHRFPEETEGELTRIKSIVVSRTTCAKISETLGLPRFLLLGKGLSVNESVPMSVAAAVFESLIAGVYLDGGLEPSRRLIERVMCPEIELAGGVDHGRNYKSLLQQYAQKMLGATPVYRLLDEKGPDHSKCFKVAALIGQQTYHPAWGANKKAAEQRAAQNALYELEGKPIPHRAD